MMKHLELLTFIQWMQFDNLRVLNVSFKYIFKVNTWSANLWIVEKLSSVAPAKMA